ncbi:MAG: hypothetical protein AAGF96_00490 [Bacteroidota bacterium]
MKENIQKHRFFFFRSMGIHFCKEFLKPWKGFRKWMSVFANTAKNTSEEAPFLPARTERYVRASWFIFDCLRRPLNSIQYRGRGRQRKENTGRNMGYVF